MTRLEREEKVMRSVFGVETDIWGTNATASTILGDEVWFGEYQQQPPKPPAEKVIDAPFRVLEDAPTKAARELGMPPMIADAALRASFSNGRGRRKIYGAAPGLTIIDDPTLPGDT